MNKSVDMPSWEKKRSWLIRSFLLLQHSRNQPVQTYLDHIQSYINITRTGSNISCQKIAKQHNRDENSVTRTGSNISYQKIAKQHNRDEKSITSTGSNISYQIIAKQHNRDKNMWIKFIQKI